MAIETQGGAGIEGDANPGQDFVNRDKLTQNAQQGAQMIQINKQGARELSKIHARLARLEIETTARSEKQAEIATEIGRLEDRADQREQRFEDLIIALRADLVAQRMAVRSELSAHRDTATADLATYRETVRADLVTHREAVRVEMAAQLANRPAIRPSMADILSIVLAIALIAVMLVFSWLLWASKAPAGLAYWPWW
jgi:DNA repair exonuclease SbcCD ATPase subunit